MSRAIASASSFPDFQVSKSLTETLEDFRTNLTCKICFRILYEPYTTQCGHTFCYSCLSQWFTDNNNVHKKTCPDCRAIVQSAPAPAYLVRDMAQKFVQQIHLLGEEDETLEQHLRLQAEEAALVERDRASEKGLFKGRFKKLRFSPLPVIHDVEDGVTRCPSCAWEMENGDRVCHRCGLHLDDYDSEMDSDYDPEDENIPMPWSPGGSIRSEYEDDELDGEIDFEDADVEDDFRTPRWSDGMESDPGRALIVGDEGGGPGRPLRVDELDGYDNYGSDTDTSRSDSYGPRAATDDEGDSTMGDFVVDEVDEDGEESSSSDEEDDDDSGSQSSASTPRQAPLRTPAHRPKGARRSNPYVISSSSSSSESNSTPPREEESYGEGPESNSPPPRSDRSFSRHQSSFDEVDTTDAGSLDEE